MIDTSCLSLYEERENHDPMLLGPAGTAQRRRGNLGRQARGPLAQFTLWTVTAQVGAPQQQIDDPAFPRIACRRGASDQPTPALRGTGVRVQTIVVAAQHWGLSPKHIASEYDLPATQVEEALAFYAAHRAEIDAAFAAEDRFEAESLGTLAASPRR